MCHAECKWPNDVLLGGKKFCGILPESARAADALSVVVGIGINANQMNFPESLRDTATSLAIETGTVVDRASLLATTLRTLEALYRLLHGGDAREIVRRWKLRSTMLGKEVEAERDGKTFRGVASDIAEDGSLIIRTAGGSHRLYAGEVTILHN